MNNKKYRCPYCEQTSSRMWNLRVHLRRRHEAKGEQVGPSQAGPAYNHEPIYGFKPREKLSGRLSKNDFNSYSRGDRGGERIGIRGNPLDDTIKDLRRAVEIKRLIKELDPKYKQPQFWLTPSIDHFSNNQSEGFHQIFDSISFKPETDPLRDRVIGLRCRICETCLSTVPLPIYGFKESSKLIESFHQCNSMRVAKMQGLTSPDRRSKIMGLYRSSPETMKKAVQDWWLEGVSPHLIVVPFISAGNDTYEITPQLLKDYQWLSTVIEEEKIILDDSYLSEFMLFARGNTFVKFSIRESNTTLRVPSYFMTLSKGPFLPFSFTIDNPQSQL